MNNYKRGKHKDIVDDYKKAKHKHLEKLATRTLANDKKSQQLKSKVIKGNFLKNF